MYIFHTQVSQSQIEPLQIEGQSFSIPDDSRARLVQSANGNRVVRIFIVVHLIIFAAFAAAGYAFLGKDNPAGTGAIWGSITGSSTTALSNLFLFFIRRIYGEQ